jgi:hypothetical protein
MVVEEVDQIYLLYRLPVAAAGQRYKIFVVADVNGEYLIHSHTG